MYTDFVKKTRN